MNAEGSVRRVSSTLPTTDEIYRLIDSLSDRSDHLARIAAMAALRDSRDPRAVIPLTICCRDENIDIRRHAVKALAAIRSVRSVPVLRELAKDRDEDFVVRRTALSALADIKAYHALNGLSDLAKDDNEDPAIRNLAARILLPKK
jgi:HEAT repeat protein